MRQTTHFFCCLQKPRGGKGKKKAAVEEGGWDWAAEREEALEVIAAVLPLDLNRIWVSTSERDIFIK